MFKKLAVFALLLGLCTPVFADAPTLSNCGTDPSIDSNSHDMAGIITVGSGVSVTSCTVTLDPNGYPGNHINSCVVSGPVLNFYSIVATTGVFTITAAVSMDEQVIHYLCSAI